uniref:Uncharacterized protein n=1 Tax=Buteo japonicus TaxID=224669 RepID=A0A8C0C4D5_9AVES
MGPFHGVQSFRSTLLQRGSPTGSQVLPENLLHGLLSPQIRRSCQEPAPARGSHGVTASFGNPPAPAWGPPRAAGGDLLHRGPPWTAGGQPASPGSSPRAAGESLLQLQGRPGETTGMNSALGQNVSSNLNGNNTTTSNTTSASCRKNKEEKPGKNQGSRGSKWDKDVGKYRKDKQHDLQQGHPNVIGGGSSQVPSGYLYGYGTKGGGGGSSSPFHCTSSTMGKVSKSTLDLGLLGNSVLVKKEEEEASHRRIKRLKIEKVGQASLHPFSFVSPCAYDKLPTTVCLAPVILVVFFVLLFLLISPSHP